MNTVDQARQKPSSLSANTMQPVFSKVIARKRHFDDVVSLAIEAPDNFGETGFLPGQFNMLYAFGVGEIAISISGDPDEQSTLIHTIRDVGAVSHALTELKPGDTVGVRGPFGSDWPVQSAQHSDVIIVAGGLGLAPVKPAIHSIINHRERYRRVALVYGARSPAELLYTEELENWANHDIDVHVTVDHATEKWHGQIGLVTHLLDQLDVEFSTSVSFVCGPEVMMRHTARELELLGARDANIHLSMERNMKCALAWCGHCQYGSHFICKDGPVFTYASMRELLGIREL